MTRTRPLVAPGTLFLLVLALGCGPVEYINQVSGRAATALAAARERSAAERAPYEYRKAIEYHRKAEDAAGRACYQAAIDYGHHAEEWANKASALAKERSAETGAP